MWLCSTSTKEEKKRWSVYTNHQAALLERKLIIAAPTNFGLEEPKLQSLCTATLEVAGDDAVGLGAEDDLDLAGVDA
jgi:hypothetical protein